jgi:hypothetical protein
VCVFAVDSANRVYPTLLHKDAPQQGTKGIGGSEHKHWMTFGVEKAASKLGLSQYRTMDETTADTLKDLAQKGWLN